MTATNLAVLGGAWNVQRRLIRYAVIVPATKLIALDRSICSPTALKSNTYSPKSTIADKPPVTTNRHTWVFRLRCALGGAISATRAAYVSCRRRRQRQSANPLAGGPGRTSSTQEG